MLVSGWIDGTKHHVVVLYKYSAERTRPAANLYKKLWTLTTNSCLHPPPVILFPLPANPKIAHATNRSHTACLPVCLYIYSYVCSWCNSIKKIKELSKEASSSTDPTTPATPKPPASFLSDVKRRGVPPTLVISMETARTKISQGIIKKKTKCLPSLLRFMSGKGKVLFWRHYICNPGWFFLSQTRERSCRIYNVGA